MIDTLAYLPHVSDLDQVLESADVQEIVKKSLEMLAVFTKEAEFTDYFTTEGHNLFLKIVLPYLKITESERESLEENPKEFCHLIEDVCGEQKSSTVKVRAAKLLCSMSSNVGGFYESMM